jgi:hypothetical protein
MHARTLTALLTPALLLVGLAWVATPASAGEAKVEICHFPPGNPDNFHTLRISQSALSAHLAHGDVGDNCDAHCETLCDDGNACTIDSCDSAGGCAAPEPTDCNDGDLCTTDSCDPVTGCGNECVDCTAPDLCTISTCAPDTGACVDTPVVCPDGETCDPATGACATSEVGVPCNGEPPGLVLDGADWSGTSNAAAVFTACVEELHGAGCDEATATTACEITFILYLNECDNCIIGGGLGPDACAQCATALSAEATINCPGLPEYEPESCVVTAP